MSSHPSRTSSSTGSGSTLTRQVVASTKNSYKRWHRQLLCRLLPSLAFRTADPDGSIQSCLRLHRIPPAVWLLPVAERIRLAGPGGTLRRIRRYDYQGALRPAHTQPSAPLGGFETCSYRERPTTSSGRMQYAPTSHEGTPAFVLHSSATESTPTPT